MQPLSHPPMVASKIRRVALVFSGGPAPAANAVIATAASAFLRSDIEVLGILNGYSRLADFCSKQPLLEGKDYLVLHPQMLRRTRNSQGVLLGTARENPGRAVRNRVDLVDDHRTARLRAVYAALCSLKIDALISIGGDGTLITANMLKLLQVGMADGHRHIRIIHLPKTIDNDYMGIDFTFGFFTAVETLAMEIRNLLADAEATRSYYIVATMGRTAGWLAYGAAIASEASLVIGAEDLVGCFCEIEGEPSGGDAQRPVMNMTAVIGRIVTTMRAREQEGKMFGVVVLAEGLTRYLPSRYLGGQREDDFGNIPLSQISLANIFAKLVHEEYLRQTGEGRKVVGIQLGYESRCARPHAYDVVLGSQIGVGAYRALIEKELDGVMVSVSGQVQLQYVPFEDLVEQQTLKTIIRCMTPGSDFHRLARFLETYVPESASV
jgi:ATP-dependent phosphofructokinase / diphosphate-dependent phosphofructokinase